ncbi:MAG TPA: hypothetical protein DCR06_07935, partial [Planctomycetaceae bacterium]|nr:hypothetical protein [Planctomycetaceae bacterium]
MKVLSISACPLLVLLLVYSSRAIAEEIPPKANEDSAFTTADVNNDGRLGPEEVKNDTLFQRMDANSNGFVSRKEAQSFIQKRRAREHAEVAKGVSGRPVFPASTEDEAAKRKLLSTIADITSSNTVPPNIVLLFADDLGYGDTSLYGSEKIPTPNIDSLGKQGVRFSNAYVTAASCSPSRAGLMSGQYQQR